jgi:DNA-binding response OmpR family regulator
LREAEIAKILVIDDEAAMRRMIGRVLSGAGHEVLESEDGVDGLRKFRAEAPAIVITDIIMPHRDGLETIREIRDAKSKTGIIAISGGGIGDGALYLSISEEFGADAIVQKPFRPAELIAAVDKVLERLAQQADGR